jgi:iron complex transport system substrate-binding protein
MRVAALLPAATDIVIALGAGEQLVAVTHACLLPRALAHVPRVTRSRVTASGAAGVDAMVSNLSSVGAPFFELDETMLSAQRPDVILTQAVCDVCAVREEDARAVAARMSTPPLVATLGATTVEGVLEDCLSVARALGVPEEGEELVAGLRSRIGAVHRRLKQARAPRPFVLVLEWTEPPFNAGHWVPDQVRRAGGAELYGETGGVSRRLSFDEIRGRDPSVVVIAPCGYSLSETAGEARAISGSEFGAWLRSKSAWAIDANRLTSSPGPGVVHGIEVLARIMHPDLFGAPAARDAIALFPRT